jgi:signal transduction histidine kinase
MNGGSDVVVNPACAIEGGTLIATATGIPATQSWFVALAAHELRDSITIQRTLAEVALADADADTAALRRMGEHVLAACLEQARLLDALLALAHAEHGPLPRGTVDLAVSTAEALGKIAPSTVTVQAALGPARTAGNPDLIGRLVANLLDNAERYNAPDGRIEVATYTARGRAFVMVANTGPVVPPDEISRLFKPFQRLPSQPDRPVDGAGLGLAIVSAIAAAHDATLAAHPRPGGGLRIEAGFPAPG